MKIDAEFRALIPPLKAEEKAQLEANLVANGCRDPLVTWRGTLIDGHNRFEICERLKIRYRAVEVALASRIHVLLWIEENQLGRRNLTDDQRAVIALAVYKRRTSLAKSERGKQGGRGHKKLDTAAVSKLPRDQRTSAKVAKTARVSERKLRTVAEIEKKAPEALPAIRSGEKTIAEVKTAIRRTERLDKITRLSDPGPLPDRRFPILLVDPPWRYDYTETDSRAIENQYPTMSLADLCTFKVRDIAAKDAVLFLWATSPKLVEALQVISAWGFEYRTSMVWVKDKIGMGYYVRSQHELLLIAKRGELPMPEPAARPSSVLTASRGKHSEKPEQIYALIETMYPTLPRIELFARGRRDGWTAWGNQANGSETEAAS